jgi:hypothetical protein
MGKAAKAHRKKVEKRNAKIKQQKSGMQKAFDMLLKQQLENLKEEELKAQVGEQDIKMEVVDDRVIDHAFSFIPNAEESEKINKEFEDVTPVEDQISELEK